MNFTILKGGLLGLRASSLPCSLRLYSFFASSRRKNVHLGPNGVASLVMAGERLAFATNLSYLYPLIAMCATIHETCAEDQSRCNIISRNGKVFTPQHKYATDHLPLNDCILIFHERCERIGEYPVCSQL